jgi:hypothetical protein
MENLEFLLAEGFYVDKEFVGFAGNSTCCATDVSVEVGAA